MWPIRLPRRGESLQGKLAVIRRRPRARACLLGMVLCAGSVGVVRRARGCEGSTDQVAGYSLLNDQYVSQEESVSGTGSARYLVRRLTTDEVVDYIGCEGSGPCSLG